MFKGKTIIISPCKDKALKKMSRVRAVPVDYRRRERMRMSNHHMNVWVKTGPNTECNHYLRKCRPINRMPNLFSLMKSPSIRRKSMVRCKRRMSPICVIKPSPLKRLRRTRRRTRSRVIVRSRRRSYKRRRSTKMRRTTKRKRSYKKRKSTKRRRSSKRRRSQKWKNVYINKY